MFAKFWFQFTCCCKSKQSLGAAVWEEQLVFLHSNTPYTHWARKSPLPRANHLPTQYIFRPEPYICWQSTVHQAAFYSWDVLANVFLKQSATGWHWYLCANVKAPLCHSSTAA